MCRTTALKQETPAAEQMQHSGQYNATFLLSVKWQPSSRQARAAVPSSPHLAIGPGGVGARAAGAGTIRAEAAVEALGGATEIAGLQVAALLGQGHHPAADGA